MAIAFLALSAVIYPLISEIDPWHGHVVVGSTNPASRVLALLNHRHIDPAPHRHTQSLASGESTVLSISERTMLSSLSNFAAETALVPGHSVPMLSLFLVLALGFVAVPKVAMGTLPPPSPPPRRHS